jgi:GT2 family glycosyltransferase
MVDATVIIVTYNSSGTIRQSIRSYLNAGIDQTRIVLVDNASSDGTVQICKSEFALIRYIEQKENIGYGKAINSAAVDLATQYLVIANPDVEMREDTINLCVKELQQDPSVGAVGCTLYDGNRNNVTRFSPTGILRAAGMILFDQGLSGIVRRSQQLIRPSQAPFGVRFIEGSFMVVRRSAFEAVGGFDEGIFLFSEDADFCYRLHRKGWKLLHIPAAEAVHLGGKSFSSSGEDVRFLELYRGLIYFYKKHFPIRSMLLEVSLMCAIILKLVWTVLFITRKDVQQLRRAKYTAAARLLFRTKG